MTQQENLPSAANAPSAAPSEAKRPPLAPAKNWVYPCSTHADPFAAMAALAKAKGGFYPVGNNGLWHGGIHFDSGTQATFDQSSVRCMADGEVVAYRVDERYPVSEFAGDVPTLKRAPFSTGFVLVRHRLQAPALNKPGSATPPAITLYSLYMHLQDWQGYTAKPDLPKPAFWGAGLYKVNCQTDVVQGLRARKGNNRTYPVQCVLPRGTVVEVDPKERSGGWRKVVSCTPAADQAVGCWVFSGEMDHLGDHRYRIGKSAKDPFSADIKGLHVRESKSGGAILGVLPDGSLVKAQGEPSDDYWQLSEVVSGTATPAIAAGQGYVWRKSLVGDNKPKAFDSVVVLDTPQPIKAGELIGHLGLYQNHDEAAASPLLHVELFTTDDMPAFVAKSREWASQLPASEQTLLKVHKGSRLIGHKAAFSAENPPKHSDSGAEIGCDLLIPQSYLDGLPVSHKITSKPADKNSQPQRYWRIDNLLCDKEQQPISGWVIEQDPLTTRHSPWEWQGYDFIENSEPPKGALAYYLNALRRLTDDEKVQYQALIDQSDKGPVKQRLYDVIDTNQDGRLTSDEIRTALTKPWQAQSLGQLITQHESEWFWNQTKWDELDVLMEHTPADPNAVWVEEKKRIQKLCWWEGVAEKVGLDGTGRAWHVRMIDLVFLVAPSAELISIENMKKIFPNSHEFVREEVRILFNKYAALFGISTPERISQFFAQVKAEVGDDLVGKEESLWYSVEALKSKFARYFGRYPEEADALGYKRISMAEYNSLPASVKGGYRVIKGKAYSQLPQEDEIAKRIYCCSVPGQNFHLIAGGCSEGLSYKGKGFIQLTWKENYKEVERVLKRKIPNENVNIVANPEQILETKYGLLSALGFWEWKGLNAKSGDGTVHTDDITKVVNLYTDSYEKRRENFEFIYGILKSA